MVPEIANATRTLIINNVSTTNGGTAAGYVDTLGADYVSISVHLPTADVVSNTPSVLRILESDATQPTAPTNYATFSGFVSGTDYTIPNAITAATSITKPFAVFNLRTNARKRYIRLEVSPRTTQIVTADAVVLRQQATPSTSAGATLVVNG